MSRFEQSNKPEISILYMALFIGGHQTSGKHATLITSQLPVKQWYEIIGEKTMADAILDRIVHNAHRMELRGESLRRKWNKTITEQDNEF